MDAKSVSQVGEIEPRAHEQLLNNSRRSFCDWVQQTKPKVHCHWEHQLQVSTEQEAKALFLDRTKPLKAKRFDLAKLG